MEIYIGYLKWAARRPVLNWMLLVIPVLMIVSVWYVNLTDVAHAAEEWWVKILIIAIAVAPIYWLGNFINKWITTYALEEANRLEQEEYN